MFLVDAPGRSDSRARFNLPEFIEESEHFGGRKVWHPLFDADNVEYDRLIKATGMEKLGQRSQECLLCVYSTAYERDQLCAEDAAKVAQLESQLSYPIQPNGKTASLEAFDLGCGAKYGCGE